MADDISREQRAPVDLEGQQIADRVGVFRPVQAMGGHTARFESPLRGAVELRFEPSSEPVVSLRVRPRPSAGGHHPAAQLHHHGFPHGRRLADVGHIQRVQRQSARF